MKTLSFAVLLSCPFLVGDPGSAATVKWTAGFTATTPFAGINDVHFEWEVVGGNGIVDVSALPSSFDFGDAGWTKKTDDKKVSATMGSLDLSDPPAAFAKDTKLNFKFSIFVSGGDTPKFTKAYWTVNGIGADQPAYQIDLKQNQLVFDVVPLPSSVVLLGLGLAGLAATRRGARRNPRNA